MAVDLESRPQPINEAPAAPPTARRSGRRWPAVVGSAGLAVVLGSAAVVATWPGSTHPDPASAPGASTSSNGSSHVTGQTSPQGGSGGAGASSPGSAPAVPGTRPSAGSSVQATPAPSGGTTGTPWTRHDPAALSAQNAAYFIAGTIYGDPPGNRAGTVTMSSATLTHLRRGKTSGVTLEQLQQAVQVLGGRVSIARHKSGGGKAAFSLPAGHSIVLDTHGWVRIDGADAFGLRRTATGWTSTASGSQVRAFLAGFIEGEGSVGGKIGDDPTASHLAFIQALMSTSQAYGVRTVLTGTKYFGLSVASKADFPKVQAYPFITYARCPGGRP